MLRRFAYLDTEALAQYVAALEGGLRQDVTETDRRDSSKDAGADIRVAKASVSKGAASEESRRLADTNEARFDRLLTAAAQNADRLDWLKVLEAETSMPDAAIGTMIEWECDLFVPDVVRTLASVGDASAALSALSDLAPLMGTFGIGGSDDLPDSGEVAAMAGFVEAMDAKLIVVGEDLDSEWKISATLDPEFIQGDFEGDARIVGKVAKRIRTGRSKPFLTFPGMNLMSRQERRQTERSPIPEGKEDEYLIGPALMLDLLAIYR